MKKQLAASDGSGVQVGIVLPTKDEPRWIQDETRFGEILDQAGFTYQVLFSRGSSATEKANVETLVSNGIQVLILCPQDSAAAASTVDYAADNGAGAPGLDKWPDIYKKIRAAGKLCQVFINSADELRYIDDIVEISGSAKDLCFICTGDVRDKDRFDEYLEKYGVR